MVEITQEKQFISFISIVVPNGTKSININVSKISRKQLISMPESKSTKRKNAKIARKFPVKEKKHGSKNK